MPGPFRYRLSGLRARAPKSVDLAVVARVLGVSPEGLSDFKLVRRSLDARQKPVLFWDLSVEFSSAAPLEPRLSLPLRFAAAPAPRGPELLLPPVERAAKTADVGTGPAGLFAALAIHDTSSVVGAATAYGPKAVEVATTVKLARALWNVPLTLGTASVRAYLEKKSAAKNIPARVRNTKLKQSERLDCTRATASVSSDIECPSAAGPR